jgi:trehalose synthase-fused probable maltokinase
MSFAAWMPTRRWFGGKGRTIVRIERVDRAAFSGGTLTIAEVEYGDGGVEWYFIPMTVAGDDALGDAGFCCRLLGAIRYGARVRTAGGGEIRFEPAAGFARPAAGFDEGLVRQVGSEQSNTSVIYGASLILKVFRRLQPGVNPDVEVLGFLAERTAFRQAPRIVGTVEYRRGDERYSLAVLEELVENEGDGWSWVLAQLCHSDAPLSFRACEESRSSTPGTGIPRSTRNDNRGEAERQPGVDAIAELGRVTAGLHLALACDAADPAFGPRSITQGDIEVWKADILGRLERLAERLTRAMDSLPDSAREPARLVGDVAPELRSVLGGLDVLGGGEVLKTRVHGDYHLGQVLKTADGWTIIDFEGEPLRPIAERRARHTPLKDAAGMLRSFDYARHTAARSGVDNAEAWEEAARRAFLDAYLQRAREGGARFLPDSDAALHRALAALELDKALYELEYELGNRPDWVEIPLAALAAGVATPRPGGRWRT